MAPSPTGVPRPPPAASIPADLVHLLLHRVGLPEDEVKAMSRDQAISRAQQYWSEGP
jgi:hypothetical protein